MTRTKSTFLALLAVLLSPMAANADLIDTFDNGWYNSSGLHNTANTNIFTGYFSSDGREYRDFQAFDLSSVSGTITAATLTYYAGNGLFESPEGTETIQIADFTSSIDDLLNGLGGISAFDDLGTGTIFGSATVTQADFTSMPSVTISLNSFGVAALNAALAGADQRIVLGGSLTTLDFSGGSEALFSGSSGIPSSYLSLTTTVPEPGTLALLGLGLAGIAATRRKKKV